MLDNQVEVSCRVVNLTLFIIILFWKSVPFNKSSFLFIKVEDAFEKNEVDVVAEKLIGMQASLRLLQHAADYQVEYVLDYSSMLQTTRLSMY